MRHCKFDNSANASTAGNKRGGRAGELYENDLSLLQRNNSPGKRGYPLNKSILFIRGGVRVCFSKEDAGH